jgi:alanine racemase
MVRVSMTRAWVEIHLDRLAENIRAVRGVLPAKTALIFVVKANAYGHGLEAVARRAAQEGVEWFAVAHADEAQVVHAQAPRAKILLLGASDPADVPELAASGVIPVVYSEEQAAQLSAAAAKAGVVLPAHLKIDTGMGRFGVDWSVAAEAYGRMAALPGLRFDGLCTHFASVEPKRPSLGAVQIQRFDQACRQIARMAGRPLFRHASSSRALEYHAEWDLDGVRPGIVLYGYGSGEAGMRVRTRPVLEWKASVMQVRDVPAGHTVGYYSTFTTSAPTRIATVGVGYADGYSRALSGKGFVLIRGRRCPVVGRVSMNWITVDLGPDGEGAPGDEAVLIGEQAGESIWADELARLARTIAYEMLTSISALCPRRYGKNG